MPELKEFYEQVSRKEIQEIRAFHAGANELFYAAAKKETALVRALLDAAGLMSGEVIQKKSKERGRLEVTQITHNEPYKDYVKIAFVSGGMEKFSAFAGFGYKEQTDLYSLTELFMQEFEPVTE